jgi:polyhydroxybutyrate depolymerase
MDIRLALKRSTKRWLRQSLMLTAGLFAVGCIDGDPPTSPDEPLPPLRPWNGVRRFVDTLSFEGFDRVIRVNLPQSYEHDEAERIPLLLGYHGAGEDAEGFQRGTGLDEIADDMDFAVVYVEWVNGWTLTPPSAQGVDDIAYTRFLVAHMIQSYALDPDRVMATGFSFGGMFSLRLACEANSPIHGVGTVGSTMATSTQPVCETGQPPRPIPAIVILGAQDHSVPAEGRDDLLSLDDTGAVFRRVDGCADTRLETFLPQDPSASPRSRIETWEECGAGSGVRIDLVDGAGHSWLRGETNPSGIDYGREIAEYLLSHFP